MSDVTMIAVSTVPASVVPEKHVQITARTKQGKDGTEIAAENRSRSIIIAELTPAVSSKYVSLVCGALYEVAKQQLTQLWRDNDPKEVAAALFSEDGLLAFSAREAESKRLTGDSITSWWNEGAGVALKSSVISSHGEKGAGMVIERLKNLAAPTTTKFNIARCQQYIALIGEHCDIEDEFTSRLVSKLAEHQRKLEAEAAENEAAL